MKDYDIDYDSASFGAGVSLYSRPLILFYSLVISFYIFIKDSDSQYFLGFLSFFESFIDYSVCLNIFLVFIASME